MDERVEQYYYKYARKGIILTLSDLKEFARANKINVPSDIELRKLRHYWKYISIHKKWKRPSHFISPSVPKLGSVHMDMAEFHRNLRVSNGNRWYILVGVDSLSQRAWAKAYPNKTRTSWEDGANLIISTMPSVRVLVTDRDGAISGEAFQRRVKKEKNVKWVHLKSRSKAYLAERFIQFLKRRLQTALDLNKPDNNWVQWLEGIVSDYNSRYCKGTKLRRIDITKETELEVVRQQMGVKGDVTPLFNTATLSNFSPFMRKKLKFKFQIGDPVQISMSSNYMLRKDTFAKKSVTGNWSKTCYTVAACLLKSNSEHFYTFCYRLKELDGVWYESELIPCYWQLRDKEQEQHHHTLQQQQEEKASEGIKKRLRSAAAVAEEKGGA